MKPIAPKDGEHPLATGMRKLHREMAAVYALVWGSALGVIAAGIADPQQMGWWQFLIFIPGAAAGGLCILHWRWSKQQARKQRA